MGSKSRKFPKISYSSAAAPRLTAVFIALLLFIGVAAQNPVSMTGFVSMIRDSDYTPLEENLIVVEVTPEGIPVEKRLAKDADLFFYRQLRTKVLFGVGGASGYESELVLSLRNVSGRPLENVSVIETIPEEMAASASMVESDRNFLVLNQEPAIIQFFINQLEDGQEQKLSYKLSKTDSILGEKSLESMQTPKALVKLEEDSCVGIVCKDLDPCTRDYCGKGECFFEQMPEGAACGEGKQCIAGNCVEAALVPVTPGMELIGLAFLAIAIAFAAVVLLAKGKKKQERGEK